MVTGANSGIGKCTAMALAKKGVCAVDFTCPNNVGILRVPWVRLCIVKFVYDDSHGPSCNQF